MTKQIEVGKTYTAADGTKWRCIAVDGDCARMHIAGLKYDAAYAWKLDGRPIGLPGEHNHIVFEPERGEVVLTSWGTSYQWLRNGDLSMVDDSHDKYRLTLPTLDGKLAPGAYVGPDGHRIKVEKL